MGESRQSTAYQCVSPGAARPSLRPPTRMTRLVPDLGLNRLGIERRCPSELGGWAVCTVANPGLTSSVTSREPRHMLRSRRQGGLHGRGLEAGRAPPELVMCSCCAAAVSHLCGGGRRCSSPVTAAASAARVQSGMATQPSRTVGGIGGGSLHCLTEQRLHEDYASVVAARARACPEPRNLAPPSPAALTPTAVGSCRPSGSTSLS